MTLGIKIRVHLKFKDALASNDRTIRMILKLKCN